ncbi:MAG: helix-turn-helix domain-containing protein [Cetobacterium sp.]
MGAKNGARSLREVRHLVGHTQTYVADGIGTTQSGVSRLETQSDMLVSTLTDYVEALGGRLRLVVDHPLVEVDVTLAGGVAGR